MRRMVLSFRRWRLPEGELMTGLIGFGISGYMIIEGWGFFDSLYMTVITITTGGFREVRDVSGPGKIFTLVLIFMGIVG